MKNLIVLLILFLFLSGCCENNLIKTNKETDLKQLNEIRNNLISPWEYEIPKKILCLLEKRKGFLELKNCEYLFQSQKINKNSKNNFEKEIRQLISLSL